ncbi:TetR/AcrR family transcriptional regulator [Paenibacillus sp. WLX1005]|uniref:TetR/AcrR family transcriptional regulator n=1 Tax=Paenibacillus sp. WLX1005 TaxID=3243766 RepID=UPI003983F564
MNTKQKILKESIKLFAEHGFEGTSMTKIANVLGFTKPALYAHYDNKVALFETCLDTIAGEQIEFIQSTLDNPNHDTVEKKLYHVIKDCKYAQESHAFLFYNRFYLLPPQELKQQIQAKLDDSTQQWVNLLSTTVQAGIQSGEIDNTLTMHEVVSSYVCILNGIGFDDSSNQNIDHIWKIFWKGIRAA